MKPLPPFLHHPSKLFVEITTRCNLRCRMCVKETWEKSAMEGTLTDDVFESLAPAFPNLDALVLNGVGESLLDPRLEEFIRQAKRTMKPEAWIGIQTNGLLLNEERACSLVDAGLDLICVSVDAASPELFKEIRRGGEGGDVESALCALSVVKTRFVDKSIQVGVEFVLMRDNADELPSVLRWAISRGAAFAIVSHVLPYTADCAGQAAYDSNMDAAVDLFTDWRNRALSKGFDLCKAIDTGLKRTKLSHKKKQMTSFVEAMEAEANYRGISFNLKNLVERNSEWTEKVKRIFAKLKMIAHENEMSLRLPVIAPTSERKCDFIEEGCVFVSCKGDVHPCYFLWHGYSCHFFGRKKHVNPRSFGNLSSRGIMDIWNSEEYRSFRRDAIGYDYPYCSNCEVVPCEFMEAEEFERDCYGNSVPCADCFWAMGMFNCLR